MLVLASATTGSAQGASQRPAPARPAKAENSPPADTPPPKIASPPPADAPAPPSGPAMVRLQFPNSDVVDVLHLYEQLTGKKLVMDNFVQGKVNIFIAKDVSREEAIKIIEMSMGLNGISLVPAAPGIIDVVGAGQNPRKAPVPIISDVADIPPGNPVVSFLFKLQYADPQELQQVLMAYFQGSSGTINILALPKSSSLLVTQNADIIRQLAGVIDQVDVAPAEVVSEFIKLERADASKVVDMLKEIFEKGTESPTQPGVRSVKVPGAVPQPQQQRGTGQNPNSTGLSSSASSSSSSGSALNISEELSTQPVNTTPQAVTIGNAKLIADQRANSIIVLGNREVVVKVEKILDEMDVAAPQVALSTVVGQLSLSNDDEFGADYFAKYHNRFVGTSTNNGVFSGNNPGIPATAVMDPSKIINFSKILKNAATGTNVYVAAGDAFAAIVHLLEQTGKFKIISRPTVFTSNNKKAIIASGQEVPVPVSTLTNATSTLNVGSIQSSIEYKKVALQLEVVPLINAEKQVSLDILQKIDSLGENKIISGNVVPAINTRYIRTNVSAPNKATIVLGGLIEDNKQKNSNGIPYLSRIPYLGAAFRSTKVSVIRTELIVLMRPEV